MDYAGSRWYWTIASFGLCHGCGANVDRAFIAYSFRHAHRLLHDLRGGQGDRR